MHNFFNVLKKRQFFWTQSMSWKHPDALTTDIKKFQLQINTIFKSSKVSNHVQHSINNVSLSIWIYLDRWNWFNISINQHNSWSQWKGKKSIDAEKTWLTKIFGKVEIISTTLNQSKKKVRKNHTLGKVLKINSYYSMVWGTVSILTIKLKWELHTLPGRFKKFTCTENVHLTMCLLINGQLLYTHSN